MEASGKTVGLTGGSGHLGSNILECLIDRGYKVRLLLRSPSAREVRNRLGNQKNIEIYEGDLRDIGAVERFADGLSDIIHAGAPNIVWAKNPDQEIVDPIVVGTRNIMQAALRFNVSTVIFTSSCSTAGFDSIETAPITEKMWNDGCKAPLIKAKADAEKEAWNLIEGSPLRLVTLLIPSLLGPKFYRHTPNTLAHSKMLKKPPRLVPSLGFHILDARDAAQVHVDCLENANAEGRYIIAGEFFSLQKLVELYAATIRKKIKPSLIPRWVLRLAVAADWFAYKLFKRDRELTQDIVDEFVGKFQHVDLTKAHKELGFSARPVSQTIEDLHAWLAKNPNLIR